MTEVIGTFDGHCFRATLYDNQNATDMPSHEVILTRKVHPRDSIVIEAEASEPCELVEAAATLVSLGGNWNEGLTHQKSSQASFEIELHPREPVRLAHLHFYEKTPGEPEPRWIPVYGARRGPGPPGGRQEGCRTAR